MLRLINHVREMLPWVHYSKEWDITVNDNSLNLTGLVAPHLMLHAALNVNQIRLDLIEMDEMDSSQKIVFDRIISAQEADIIGGLSLLLGQYTHQVTLGSRRCFKSCVFSTRSLDLDPGFLSIPNSAFKNLENIIDLTKNFTFHVGDKFWLSPTKQTLYDAIQDEWFHPKDNILESMTENSLFIFIEDGMGEALPHV